MTRTRRTRQQRAAGTQLIFIDKKGNRYYALDTVQVIENRGQIVATGHIWLEQVAAGQQEITLQQVDPENPSGVPREGDTIMCNGVQMKATNCTPGEIRLSGADGGNPSSLIVRGIDCCWYPLDICDLVQVCHGK